MWSSVLGALLVRSYLGPKLPQTLGLTKHSWYPPKTRLKFWLLFTNRLTELPSEYLFWRYHQMFQGFLWNVIPCRSCRYWCFISIYLLLGLMGIPNFPVIFPNFPKVLFGYHDCSMPFLRDLRNIQNNTTSQSLPGKF